MKNTTLAVLAGGAGSRMGRAKSLLAIDGVPILENLVSRIAWDGPTLLVTSPGRTRPPSAETFDREEVDAVAGEGPLRGVLTAVASAQTPVVVCLTVDMPCIGATQVRWIADALLARPDAHGLLCQRRVAGVARVEVFPCAFRPAAATAIADAIAHHRRSVHGLLSCDRFHLTDAPADWPDQTWTNLNTPADLAAFDGVE